MPDETVDTTEAKRRGRPPKTAESETVEMERQLSPQEAWEAQTPCGYCHARPGMNPATGVWVRSWDQDSKTFIEGHRFDCQRPKERR